MNSTYLARVADPGNHHRPALDTAQAVDALFQRRQLEQAVDIERHRFFDLAFDGHSPRAGAQGVRVVGRVALVEAELVEIVVAGRVLERGLLFERGVGGIRPGGQFLRRHLGKRFAVGHFPQRRAGDGAGRHLGDEAAARLEHGLGRYLGRQDSQTLGWTFDQHGRLRHSVGNGHWSFDQRQPYTILPISAGHGPGCHAGVFTRPRRNADRTGTC
jgi:hypothetical protein